MSRLEEAQKSAALFTEIADRRARMLSEDMSIRNLEADAMSDLAEMVAWLVEQAEPVQ